MKERFRKAALRLSVCFSLFLCSPVLAVAEADLIQSDSNTMSNDWSEAAQAFYQQLTDSDYRSMVSAENAVAFVDICEDSTPEMLCLRTEITSEAEINTLDVFQYTNGKCRKIQSEAIEISDTYNRFNHTYCVIAGYGKTVIGQLDLYDAAYYTYREYQYTNEAFTSANKVELFGAYPPHRLETEYYYNGRQITKDQFESYITQMENGADVVLIDTVGGDYWRMDYPDAVEMSAGYSYDEATAYLITKMENPASGPDSNIIDNGYCGDNIRWSYNLDGTLYISGSGDMWDFNFDDGDTPIIDMPGWYMKPYKSQITTIVIEEGVTSIGSWTFGWCTSAKEIYIPATVNKIGSLAFWGCGALADIYYDGTEQEWNAAIGGEDTDNDNYKGVTMHYNYHYNEVMISSLDAMVTAGPNLYDFLHYFGFGYGKVSDENLSGYHEFDFRTVKENKLNLMSCIVGHPSCVFILEYPNIAYEDNWRDNDPLGWTISNPSGFASYDKSTIDFIAENIFNITEQDLAVLVERGFNDHEFYQYEGKYYRQIGGIGDDFKSIVYHSIKEIDGYYYICFDVYFGDGYWDGYPEYVGSKYAIVKPKQLDDGVYWSMYAYSDYPLDYRGIIDEARIRDSSNNGADTVAAENSLPFLDVPSSAYYASAIHWAIENGITNGTSTTTFSPDNTCTRGQVVTFLWRAMGQPEPVTTDNIFTDVSPSDYYYKPVLWAVENGIALGTSATKFSPQQTCSTAYILTFLYRAYGVGTDGWYEEAGRWAEENGLLSGTGAHPIPTEDCPRANVVTFLYRMADSRSTPSIP